MKTKYFIFAALAGMTLASCSSDEVIAETPPVNNVDEGMAPILFSSQKNNFTRGENDFVGATAAELLGNKFVVSGYKGGQTTWTTSNTGDDAVKNNVIVFDNYLVEYAENTANTTESNSSNWEYVNKGVIKHATDKGITKQTIKYWDYSKNQYDFIAWSTGSKTAIYEGTPAAGEVLVTAITPSTAKTAAYTFTGKAADLQECYISDLVTVNKSGTAGYGEVTGYNKPVTMRFRQLGTKVRIGIYETVPGYSVKNVEFYSAHNTNLATDGSQKNGLLFTTTENDIYKSGTYTVSFPTIDEPDKADNNQAHISFVGDGTQSTTINWGGMNYTIAELSEKTTGNVFVGRTSNTASFAGEPATDYYAVFLPTQSGPNLNLRVNYTLESIDGSGEEIDVKGATAQVPSIYTTWKPGYAYTYLFKISDKTNGYTGVYDATNPNGNTTESNPAGLYPITFDAVVVNAEEDKTQETITLVSAPSITTYQNGSNVVNKNEYEVLTLSADKPEITGEIYVTVNDATTTASPDLPNGALQVLTGKVALYTVAAGTTEAEVIDALQYQDDDKGSATIMGRNKVALTETTGDNALSVVSNVTYGVDGNTITLDGAKAAKFVPAAATTYAFVYTKTAATGDPEVFYQPVAFTDATVTTKYRHDYTDATTGDVKEGVLYFKETSGTMGKYDVFLGQTVNNLYTRTGAGTNESPYVYTQASGYAVTGTDYYYGGELDYKKANNVAYASGLTGLYKASGNTFVAVESTDKITDGKAYYSRSGAGTGEDPYKYTYCVFLPEQADGLKVLTDTYVQATETSAVDGQTYFDKYTKNNGVYYSKVIKVQ